MGQLRRDSVIKFLTIVFSIMLGPMATPQAKAKSSSKRTDDPHHKSEKSDKSHHEEQLKPSKAKMGKSVAPVARVPFEPRSSKVLELVGGGSFLDGYPGIMGNSGLFIGPDLVMEAGLFYGMKSKTSNYLDGWVQGKLFVADYFFLALGGGVGKETITHNEPLVAGVDSWKETATKLRLYAGLGPQFTFLFLTGGLQVSAGFGQVMGKVENDLPDDSSAVQEKAEESTTIKSGLSYNVSVFLGFAF